MNSQINQLLVLAQTILAFVAALGLLITIHELGHYLVARWCGVKILKFPLEWENRYFPVNAALIKQNG